MKKSVFLAVKRMAVSLAVILAGFAFANQAHAQSPADITAFNLALNPSFPETINQTDTSITVPVNNTAVVTSIAANFTVSAGATVTVGGVVQVSGTTLNNFSSMIIYRVTNGTSVKNWKVTIQRRSPSLEKQMTAFSLPLPGGTSAIGTIDQVNRTVSVTVPLTLNVTSLIPTFTLSPLAKAYVGGVLQTSGVTANNFSSAVSYVIQAENQSTQVYTVTIVRDVAQTGKVLLTFAFNALNPAVTGTIDETAHTVALTVPFATNVTALVATFTSSFMSTVKIGTTAQVSGTTANDFTSAKTYTVVAEDGATQDYVVTVTKVPASTAKDILTFKFAGLNPLVNGVITNTDATNGTITATIPWSANITTLVATFTTSPLVASVKIGATAQVSGTTANDFTNALTYTVTAEDGSTKAYVVTVTKTTASTANSILTFDFVVGIDPDVIGVINQTSSSITMNVPFSQNITALIPTFTHSPLSSILASVNGGTTYQAVTSAATPLNFTGTVLFKCTAEDGLSINIYTVTIVRNAASTAAQLLTFTFNGLNSNINDVDATGVVNQTARTVTIHVPFGTPVTALVATFTLSPYATARVGGTTAVTGTLQVSGNTWNNFTAPVVYKVWAEDNVTSELYTVTVIVDPNTEKKILTFAFNQLTPPVVGVIDQTLHTVQVAIPASISQTSLVASYTVSLFATVSVDGVQQVTGVTANDFTVPRNYLITAHDQSTQNYVVTVYHAAPLTDNLITAFSFNALNPAVAGSIDNTLNLITATVPYGTNRTSLVATFTKSYYSLVQLNGVNQVSGVTANDYTSPLIFKCIAESGAIREYVVTVSMTPGSSAKDITYFAFEDLNPDVVCSINTTTLNITGTVPNGTNRGALRAFFTNSPLSTVRVTNMGVQQSGVTVNDFRAPLSYEVTAQDGTVKTYIVNIFEAPDTTKPVVKNNIQTVSNSAGQFVLLQSNESAGKVYIVINSASQATIADLEASVVAKQARSAYVSAANQDIPISTAGMPEGTYNTYAIDAAGNKSAMGSNHIFVLDRMPPTVSVAAQTLTNSLTHTVDITSSDNGLVYLVKEGIPQASKSDFDAAVNSKRGAKGLVISPNTPVSVNIFQLEPGNYHAYAVDISLAQNISTPSANVVVITEASRIKSILAYSFNQLDPPVIGQIVGTDITLKLRVGTPITNLVATFIVSPLSNIRVGLTPQVSGVTPNDFTNPVIYTVTAEDGTSLQYTVTVEFNTGIEISDWITSIKAYPNPVTDKLTIEPALPLDRILILNELGQTMSDIQNSGQTTVTVPTSTWRRGMYFVRFYSENNYLGIQKIIKN